MGQARVSKPIFGSSSFFTPFFPLNSRKNQGQANRPSTPFIFLKGKISNQSESNHISQIIANKIYTTTNLRNKLTQYINIKIDNAITEKDSLNELFKFCNQNKGNTHQD